jgi:hypothetical protein
LALALCLMAAAAPASAVEPAGPRLAIVARDHGDRIITVGPHGEDRRNLVSDPDYWSFGERVSWSAAGDRLSFLVSGPFDDVASEPYGTGSPIVGVAESDGSASQVFPRAFLNASEPVMAPDGASVFFQRIKLIKVLPGRENYLFKSSLWSLDLADGSVRQRTRWSYANLMPFSFSPDGKSLAATSFDARGLRAVAVDLQTGQVSLLAREASEPVYSPDGSEVAFIRWKNWRKSGVDDGSPPIDELRVTRIGSFPRSRLLRRSRKVLAWPSWDPSGEEIAFTRTRVRENGDHDPRKNDAVMAINADGTCLTRIYSDRETVLFGATWQPGLSREAGRITC